MKEFISAFQITKMVIFEVSYYTCGSNKKPYFTTSANMFIRSKRDYNSCGQCQDSVLPKGSLARRFYKKWDNKHLNTLTEQEYQKMMADLEKLKEVYNNVYIEKDTFRNQNSNISFDKIRELSMKELNKK